MNKHTYWSELVKAQASSGKNASEFCRERGISDSSFSEWRKKLEVSDGKFVRIDGAEKIELELNAGVMLRVKSCDLSTVLRALCAR